MQVKKETRTSKDKMIPPQILLQVKKFNISESVLPLSREK
jgi:hypothetical protein